MCYDGVHPFSNGRAHNFLVFEGNDHKWYWERCINQERHGPFDSALVAWVSAQANQACTEACDFCHGTD
jgi:hypothetical protein